VGRAMVVRELKSLYKEMHKINILIWGMHPLCLVIRVQLWTVYK
jgi:hypothetical protein